MPEGSFTWVQGSDCFLAKLLTTWFYKGSKDRCTCCHFSLVSDKMCWLIDISFSEFDHHMIPWPVPKGNIDHLILFWSLLQTLLQLTHIQLVLVLNHFWPYLYFTSYPWEVNTVGYSIFSYIFRALLWWHSHSSHVQLFLRDRFRSQNIRYTLLYISSVKVDNHGISLIAKFIDSSSYPHALTSKCGQGMTIYRNTVNVDRLKINWRMDPPYCFSAEDGELLLHVVN